MAGRGGRVHHLPPSQVGSDAWEEVDVLLRLRKLFPDAKERQSADQFRRDIIARNKKWLAVAPGPLLLSPLRLAPALPYLCLELILLNSCLSI